MISYRDQAKAILNKRKDLNQKLTTIQTENIKREFCNRLLNGYFKNVIELLIEYYDLNIDTEDPQLVLEELLRQEHVLIKPTPTNDSKLGNSSVTFQNIFGMEIEFILYFDKDRTTRCDIYKNQIIAKTTGTDTDLSREFLANFVADYLESIE